MNRSATVLKASRSSFAMTMRVEVSDAPRRTGVAVAGLQHSRAPGPGFEARTWVGRILTRLLTTRSTPREHLIRLRHLLPILLPSRMRDYGGRVRCGEGNPMGPGHLPCPRARGIVRGGECRPSRPGSGPEPGGKANLRFVGFRFGRSHFRHARESSEARAGCKAAS
jgi:hypothetical protein